MCYNLTLCRPFSVSCNRFSCWAISLFATALQFWVSAICDFTVHLAIACRLLLVAFFFGKLVLYRTLKSSWDRLHLSFSAEPSIICFAYFASLSFSLSSGIQSNGGHGHRRWNRGRPVLYPPSPTMWTFAINQLIETAGRHKPLLIEWPLCPANVHSLSLPDTLAGHFTA